MERLTQQIAMYEAQANAQAEETQAAKEALSEVTVLWHNTVYTFRMKVPPRKYSKLVNSLQTATSETEK